MQFIPRESEPHLREWLNARGFSSERHEVIATEALEDLFGHAEGVRQTLESQQDLKENHDIDIPFAMFVSETFKNGLSPIIEKLFDPPQLKKEK